MVNSQIARVVGGEQRAITDADGHKVVSREVTLTVRDQVPTGDSSNLPLYLAMTLAALVLLLVLRRRPRRRAS